MRRRLTDENDDIEIEKVDGEWRNTLQETDGDEDEPLADRLALDDVERLAEDPPDESDLTKRERYIAAEPKPAQRSMGW